MKPRFYMSHELALQVWRACRNPSVCFAKQTQAIFRPVFPDTSSREVLCNWFRAMQIGPPYCFMVSDQSQRRAPHNGFRTRFSGPLPESDSFYRIVLPEFGDAPFELYIASPELNFVQMAAGFSLIETLGYGYELSGTYTPQESAKESPITLLKLSSSKRLISYSEKAKGIHGAATARKAAKHVLDNSASVKETQVATLFTLPKRCHGLAMIRPVLNRRIDVDPTGKPFVSQDRFFIDLYWEGFGVGLEVDTNLHHSSNPSRIRDARRRNALRNYGYRIVEATQGDLQSALGIAGLGMQVYNLMGIRPSRNQFDVSLGFIELYRQVMRLSEYP